MQTQRLGQRQLLNMMKGNLEKEYYKYTAKQRMYRLLLSMQLHSLYDMLCLSRISLLCVMN